MLKKRERWIDGCRGFGIVLMVLGHSQLPKVMEWFIYGFHMPLFFVISGYCFSEEKWKTNGLWSLVKKKFWDYIVPYFFLGMVNLILELLLNILRTKSVGEACIVAVRQFGWLIYSYGRADKMPNCTPLWFLTCIFVANIYFYLFMLVNSEKKRVCLCIGAGGKPDMFSFKNRTVTLAY